MQLYFVPFRANWELYRPVFRSVHRGRVQLNLPGTRRIALGWGGGGVGGERRGDKGYRIHMTCYILGSSWMHDCLRANPLAGYREKFLFFCPSRLHYLLSSYLVTPFDLHSKWRTSTVFQFSNYC